MQRLELRCVAFDPFAFEAEVTAACLRKPNSEQVRYLAGYLGVDGLAVKTMLVERPYVDRHYIEEYGRYYASAFRPPPSSTTRLHFFVDSLTDTDLDTRLVQAARGREPREDVQTQLQASYRGFIVVRPLPSAPIGRTALAAYVDRGSRRFTTQPHRVHLLGLELVVDAVPFQQQEVAVGACATTAMWSALTVVSRATGKRGPTPYQVTEAATRHVLNDRQMPADGGLDLQQLLSAVRDCGFAPLVMKAAGNYSAFSHALKCYLASGIPVVLLLDEPSGHHAVTAVGFRSPDGEDDAPNIECEAGEAVISTTGLTRVYVHDDRLGPYARMKWGSPTLGSDLPTLTHLPYTRASYRFGEDPMKVYAAIVPLYPKLRLTPRGLLGIAAEIFPFMRRLVGERREDLSVELRFVLGGQYLGELLSAETDDPARIARFVRESVLPRYVGILRIFVGEGAIGDVVCDTTDIHREHPKYGSILALVPLVAQYQASFAQFMEFIRQG